MRKLLVLALLAVVMVGLFTFSIYYIDNPGPLPQTKTVIFKHGEGFQGMVDELADQQVIRYPLMFKAVATALGYARKFKAGEYIFNTAISPAQVMDMIAHGRVVIHKITIPEGLTVHEITALLMAEPALNGEVSPTIEEGSLLPETYHFSLGDKREELITRMQSGMSTALAELWEKRKPGLPFTTPLQAVTLASIVEKETGVKEERGRVASVFINRLRLGMKLQTDPTVVYGIEKNGPLGRALTLNDLQTPTPYNTYVIDGLPPGPIANPGRASLEATLNPPDTNDLYFVATGSGGHNFAATLEAHNRNVQAYRQKMREGQ